MGGANPIHRSLSEMALMSRSRHHCLTGMAVVSARYRPYECVCMCVNLQLWTAQPPLAEWIRRGQPAHTPPPGAERKGRHKGRKRIRRAPAPRPLPPFFEIAAPVPCYPEETEETRAPRRPTGGRSHAVSSPDRWRCGSRAPAPLVSSDAPTSCAPPPRAAAAPKPASLTGLNPTRPRASTSAAAAAPLSPGPPSPFNSSLYLPRPS
eukprot:365562-Chlamydomonas_euryale.AAC.11